MQEEVTSQLSGDECQTFYNKTFRKLYSRLAGELWHLRIPHERHEQILGEALQNTYVAFFTYENMPLDEKTRVRRLISIGRNKLRDAIRAEFCVLVFTDVLQSSPRGNGRQADNLGDIIVDERTPSPQEKADCETIISLLEGEIERLGRGFYTLHTLEGIADGTLTIVGLARQHGINESTAESLFYRLMGRLRRSPVLQRLYSAYAA